MMSDFFRDDEEREKESLAEEACVELHQNKHIIQWLITALFFFFPTVPNLVSNSK